MSDYEADDDLHPPPPPRFARGAPHDAREAPEGDGSRLRNRDGRGGHDDPFGAAARWMPDDGHDDGRGNAYADDAYAGGGQDDAYVDDAHDGKGTRRFSDDGYVDDGARMPFDGYADEDGSWNQDDAHMAGVDVADDDAAGDDGFPGNPRGRGAPSAGALREMTRVRSGESHADELIEAARHRDRARVLLSPGHAMAIILILTMALCASLTLLTIQGVNIAKGGDMAQVAQAAAGGGDSASADSATQGQSQQSQNGSGQSQASGTDGAGQSSDGQSPGNGSQTQDGTSQSPGDGSQTQQDAGNGQQQPDGGASGSASSSASDATSNQPANPTQPAQPDDGLIDLNTASAAELDDIKGVGPATAEKIIALREQRGGFTSVDELLDVPGIGPKTLEKMRPQITVRPRTTAGSGGSSGAAGKP